MIQGSWLTLHSSLSFVSFVIHSSHSNPRNEMADYSNGDRVEVRWQAKPFAATVVHVHSPGKVDVVYDIDGSVGIFLTTGKHGLKLLADEEKKGGGGKKKKVCMADGCSSIATLKGRTLCVKHGGEPCTVDGCSTKAQARGLCNKHGARGECGGGGKEKKMCVADGCPSIGSRKGQLCVKHGGKPCSVDGCSTKVHARGLCNKHGTRKNCSFNNCTTAAKARGRCKKHGGGSRKVCKEEGCTTLAQARGVCKKHGAYGTCKFEGCTTNANSGSSYCCKHGGRKKPCSVAGCITNAYRKGLCTKHGGGRDACVFGGCTTTQIGRKWKTCRAHGGLGYCTYIYLEEGGGIVDSKCLAPARKLGGNCHKHRNK